MLTLSTVKNFKRLNHIVAVLARHGFGELLSHLSLPPALTWRQKLARTRAQAQPWASAGQRLRGDLAARRAAPHPLRLGQPRLVAGGQQHRVGLRRRPEQQRLTDLSEQADAEGVTRVGVDERRDEPAADRGRGGAAGEPGGQRAVLPGKTQRHRHREATQRLGAEDADGRSDGGDAAGPAVVGGVGELEQAGGEGRVD